MIRRDFIKSSAMAAGTLVTPFPLLEGEEDKIKLAILGTGWWGTDMILEHALISNQYEIVALCDVNEVALENAAEKVVAAGQKKPKLFSSYQEMYELSGLTAVAIATPTHWHALHFIDACKKGLDVFLEKPISYDIREGQAMLSAHQKAKNVVLVDFPRMMVDTRHKVKAIIESGEIGKVRQIQANINSQESTLVEKEIPSTFDFEVFCGPAPRKKFLCNPNGDKPNWRGQHDFSRGIMTDWGIHYIHDIRNIMGLGVPTSVSAIGGTVKNFSSDNPDHLDVRFDFDGLPVYWSHKSWGYTSPMPDNNIGIYYYGEKGTLFAGDLGWEIYPGDGGNKQSVGSIVFNPEAPGNEEIYSKMMVDMFLELANGIRKKSNQGITNRLENAKNTTETVIFGDMAFRVKSNLIINRSDMIIENNSKAQALLKRDYRSPYQHPFV
ncbi:MAG: oxidoreductase [Cyclobacteriaceae bacterium]|nr:MAG: oxidoreductase [Cyclobacteriaceae bacterium]